MGERQIKKNTEILKGKCPHYPPISTAPNSVTEEPGFVGIASRTARDDFEMKWLISESEKWYSAIDSEGNIYKMKNPAIFRHPRWVDLERTVKYPKPILMTASELEKKQDIFLPETPKRLELGL